MTNEDFTALREQGLNYFVGAFGHMQDDGSVLFYHGVGYEEPPTSDDIEALVAELASVAEFKMLELKYGVDYVLMPISEETFMDNINNE